MRILLALLLLSGLARATGNLTEAQGADELQKELNSMNKQAEDVLQKLDQLAPGSLPAPNMPSLPGLAPGQQLDEIQARAFKLVTDQRFMHAAGELIKTEKRKKLLEIQLGFFLFMLFFKAWRQGAAQHWFKRALVGLACSILMWVGLSYAIPLAVLGEPYAIVTSTIWKVMILGH